MITINRCKNNKYFSNKTQINNNGKHLQYQKPNKYDDRVINVKNKRTTEFTRKTSHGESKHGT